MGFGLPTATKAYSPTLQLPMRVLELPVMKHSLYVVALVCVSTVATYASDVHGTITLDSRMAKKTAPPPVYDVRGMAMHDRSPTMARARGAGRFGRIAVWLEGGPVATPTSSTMRQSDRHFEPDLLIISPGSRVEFPNLDPVFHNIFSLSKAQSFDLGYYAQGKSRDVVFSKPGIVQVYCHVHPDMYGVIVVTGSGWTARPAENGTFTFTDVPPGRYRVVVWQRTTGLVHKTISIPASGTVDVSFRLPDDEAEQ